MVAYLMMLGSQRDKERFRWIYDHLRHKMYRVALRLLKEEGPAQDAVQESFSKIILKFEKISLLSCEDLEPYIVTIVENTAKDMLRRERTTLLFPEEWDAAAPEGVESSDGYHRLVALVNALPEPYREVLLLKFVEEETEPRIAKRLGISKSAVASRVSRGRSMLIERLREEGYEYERT